MSKKLKNETAKKITKKRSSTKVLKHSHSLKCVNTQISKIIIFIPKLPLNLDIFFQNIPRQSNLFINDLSL